MNPSGNIEQNIKKIHEEFVGESSPNKVSTAALRTLSEAASSYRNLNFPTNISCVDLYQQTSTLKSKITEIGKTEGLQRRVYTSIKNFFRGSNSWLAEKKCEEFQKMILQGLLIHKQFDQLAEIDWTLMDFIEEFKKIKWSDDFSINDPNFSKKLFDQLDAFIKEKTTTSEKIQSCVLPLLILVTPGQRQTLLTECLNHVTEAVKKQGYASRFDYEVIFKVQEKISPNSSLHTTIVQLYDALQKGLTSRERTFQGFLGVYSSSFWNLGKSSTQKSFQYCESLYKKILTKMCEEGLIQIIKDDPRWTIFDLNISVFDFKPALQDVFMERMKKNIVDPSLLIGYEKHPETLQKKLEEFKINSKWNEFATQYVQALKDIGRKIKTDEDLDSNNVFKYLLNGKNRAGIRNRLKEIKHSASEEEKKAFALLAPILLPREAKTSS